MGQLLHCLNNNFLFQFFSEKYSSNATFGRALRVICVHSRIINYNMSQMARTWCSCQHSPLWIGLGGLGFIPPTHKLKKEAPKWVKYFRLANCSKGLKEVKTTKWVKREGGLRWKRLSQIRQVRMLTGRHCKYPMNPSIWIHANNLRLWFCRDVIRLDIEHFCTLPKHRKRVISEFVKGES